MIPSSSSTIAHIPRFVIERKRSEKGSIIRCKNPLIPKIASAHTRLILICSKNGMKNRHKKSAVPNKVRFGIVVVLYCPIVLSAAHNARRKKFMLSKWQHRLRGTTCSEGTSRLSPRSVLLPSAEVSAGHPHPSETSPISRAYALKWQRLLLGCAEALMFSFFTFLSPL